MLKKKKSPKERFCAKSCNWLPKFDVKNFGIPVGHKGREGAILKIKGQAGQSAL